MSSLTFSAIFSSSSNLSWFPFFNKTFSAVLSSSRSPVLTLNSSSTLLRSSISSFSCRLACISATVRSSMRLSSSWLSFSRALSASLRLVISRSMPLKPVNSPLSSNNGTPLVSSTTSWPALWRLTFSSPANALRPFIISWNKSETCFASLPGMKSKGFFPRTCSGAYPNISFTFGLQ